MRKLKSLFLLAVFIPLSAGYLLAGVPYAIMHSEHRYIILIALFVNGAVIPSIIWLKRQPARESGILAKVAQISYGLGILLSIWTYLAGNEVF